tara:strand:+ start:826 stop:1194 length:369 start_codon:yes stop_codon:yes gene_type:complete
MHFRSGFEKMFSTHLKEKSVPFKYEGTSFEYIGKPKKYTPDFYLIDQDIYIETKGYFTQADRVKHLLIKDQHPKLDIRFIFMDSSLKLARSSPTTYAKWCKKYNFLYADKILPQEWLKEIKT